MTLDVDVIHQQGNFTLEARFSAGEGLTALFGPSGSGKTTIIQLVSGLIRPQQGVIRFDGTIWSDAERGIFIPPHQRRIGYVFQEGRLFPHMTVRQNLLYATRFQAEARARRDENLTRIASLLRITPHLDRRPQALSGGEKQRVALGRALMAEPRLLLMDEPLSALDEGLKFDILPDLERIRDVQGIPILFVSHAVAEITRLATRVISMDKGRIVGRAPALLLDQPGAAQPPSMMEGGRITGSFIDATVTAHLPADDLTVAQSLAGTLYLRRLAVEAGTALRVHIPASDIILATGPVTGLSALNRLPGTVETCTDDGFFTEVTVSCSGIRLIARITRLSARELALRPGSPVHVLFKALSIAPESLFRETE